MGFLAGFRRKRQLTPEHKFEYIDLRSFNEGGFLNITAYIWIYLSILISLCCIAADTYTAITLLVFNRWSSQIQPAIPFETAKIIFAVCIMFSYVLIITDWIFAMKVIKRGGVADAYMNVIALRWNCVWGGKGEDDSGWKRFLVFSRLTKQRGKTDYAALFTYFSFKGWVRIVFAEGPRVIVNAFTLASVINADLVPKDKLETLSAISKFFENIEHLYSENKLQVFVLASMAFCTILWIFAIIQLLLACITFIGFLWHVMHGDSLRKYCKDRIDTRMGEIVLANHKKGMREDNDKMHKAGILRAPTLPVPAAVALETPSYEKPLYAVSVVAGSPRQPVLPIYAEMQRKKTQQPQPLSRMPTSSTIASSARQAIGRSQTVRSNDSYDSSFALVAGQAAMGYGGQGRTGNNEGTEYAERQQQLREQWGPPPPVPSSESGRTYASSISGRSEGGRYAQSSSGRSDGGRTPAREAGRYQMQDLQSPVSQSGRGPFVADRPERQSEWIDMPPPQLRQQTQFQGQGQYGRPAPPSRSGSGRSGYGPPSQGRFPIAVRAGEQMDNRPERFPIAVRQPQAPYYNDSEQTQSPTQYYNNGDLPQQMETPQQYYPQEQREYYPPRLGTPQSRQGTSRQPPQSRQGTPQQLPQHPQPAAYEYLPSQTQQQPQSYQQNQRSELPRLQTQTPVSNNNSSGYRRPAYTPASATVPTPAPQNFDNSPASYYQEPVQMRSATAPPVRPPRSATAPPVRPPRSATARPDLERRDFEPMRPLQMSATGGLEEFGTGRRL